MTQITRNELKTILENINTPQFVGMITDTPEDMKKYLDYWVMIDGKRKKNPNPTPNPYYESGIRKVSKKYKIVTGFDYENSVNGKREKEGKERDFVSGETWYNLISKGLVVHKNDNTKFYFRYQFLPDSTTETTSYFEGQPIEKELYESYLNEKGDYENQGVDNPTRIQVCSLENIRQISIGKEKYEIVG